MVNKSFSHRLFGTIMAVGCLILWTSISAEAEVIKVGSIDYASLQGCVYADLNRNLTLDENEGLIPNVVIQCILEEPVAAGETPVTRTTTTDAHGCYSFTGLPAGTYTLKEIDPVEFMQGLPGNPGTVNGTPVGEAADADTYTKITLSLGDPGEEYNFGEGGLRSAFLSKRYLLAKQEPVEEVPEPSSALFLILGLLLCLTNAGRRHARG